MDNVRTRYAPSPTGYMHIGNLRTAIFEYLICKHNDGKFILRVEDTDQNRKVEGAVDFIYKTCELCGLDFDEGPNNKGKHGPYMQSERLNIYKEYANKLVEMGKAYYCFCDEDRLNILRKAAKDNKVTFMYDGHCKNLSKEEIENNLKNNVPYVIRQLMPNVGVSTYNDIVYGDIYVDNKILEDQILLKSDGYPTYNFANVIDDHLMDITHVARGNEYLMSTPKYNLLYDAFGWKKPVYIHLPMVLGTDGQKLSKRNGDASFMDLYEEGYLPKAIVNYLVLLGWSTDENKEIFSLEELIKIFDPSRISKSPATYDVKKLQWINAQYIKKLNIDKLLEITLPHLEKVYNLTDIDKNWLKELVCLYQDELKYGGEIVELTKMFFNDVDLFNISVEAKQIMNDDSVNKVLGIFTEEIKNIKEFNIDNIIKAINNTKEIANIKGKMLYMPIRIKLTGVMHGPELSNIIHLFGKEKVIKRLKNL